MYLNVSETGNLSLEEVDDFKRFHIAAAPAQVAGTGASDAFLELSEDAGEGHYWLDADGIAALSGRVDDPDWMQSFWTMLEKSEPYGFADVAGRRIKAHLA